MQHEIRPLQSRCLRGLHRRTLRLARFGHTGEAEGGRERREREVEGGCVCGGGLFLLSPAPAQANWRWQSGRKLWKVWVAWLAVETQGKQAILGKAWGSGLGVIGTPGPQAVKDPSLSGQLRLWPQRLLGASTPGKFENVSLGD